MGITGRHTAGMGDRHAAKLQEACTGFAAVLWEEVLKSGGESLLPTKMAGAGVFQGLACQALAMHLARAGGLSDFLYRAMAASLAGGGCEKGTG